MKRMGRLLFGMKIRYKLILMIYLVLAPVILGVSVFIYLKDYDAMREKMTDLYKNLAGVASDSIDSRSMDLLDLSTYISVNSDVRSLLTTDGLSLREKPLIWDKNAPMGFVRDMLSIKSHIKTLVIYPESGGTPFYISNDRSVHDLDIETIRTSRPYIDAVSARGDSVWSLEQAGQAGLFIYNKSDKIVISRELFDLSKKRRLAYLVISIDAAMYRDICESTLQQKNEGIVVLSGSGRLLAEAGAVDGGIRKLILEGGVAVPEGQKGPHTLEYQNHNLFFLRSQTSRNQVFYIVPMDNWLSYFQTVRWFPLLLSLILLVCLWPLSLFASSVISKPLSRLYRSMLRFKEGDFSQRVEVFGNDEIGELTRTFNQMVRDIRELIDKNYVAVLHERQSELNALQAQINPHFLYNALDSLYWQAFDAGSHELAEDILSLSQLFRLVLSRGENEVPVHKEFELISHYLHIQKMRFGKKLDYSVRLDEDVKEQRILKLILQPFVENAIVHGLELTGRPGSIRVEGRMEGERMLFEIADNGVGIAPDRLAQLLSGEGEEDREYASQRIGRYAIRNVRQRLQLKYGDAFSLDIESEVGNGTTVRVMLPVEFRQGEV